MTKVRRLFQFESFGLRLKTYKRHDKEGRYMPSNDIKTMDKVRSGRDVNVELLRILACIMVIVAHVRPLLISDDGQIMDTALLCQAFAAPAVSIFFMISGFFAPKNPNFIKTWKRCVTGVLIPALVLVIVTGFLNGYLSGDMGFFESIAHTDIRLLAKNTFEGIIGFDAAKFGDYNAHLWYIFSYILVMLFLPIMCVLAQHADRRVLWFFTILINYRLLIVDIVALYPFPVVVYLPQFLPPEIGVFILGYMIYTEGRCYRNRKLTKPLCAALFAAALIAMFLGQHKLFEAMIPETADPSALNFESPYFLSWTCGLVILASAFAVMFILSLHIRGPRISRLISFLGGLTFPIYLIHFPILARLMNIGLSTEIYPRFSVSGAGVLIYTALMTVVLFLISAVFSFVIREIFRRLKNVCIRKEG